MTTLISKISRTIRQHGLHRTLAIIAGQIADIGFDVLHGTNTVLWRPLPSLTITSPNKSRGNIYQATTTPALRRIFTDIRPLLPDQAGLLDVGSGKGKVLLVAAEFRFDPVRGVEFSGELCDIARKNVDRYFRRRHRPTVEIMEEDAAVYRIRPDEHLFFFFNPFDRLIFSVVMDNLGQSLQAHPRPAYIVYNNPEHRSAIERTAGFSLFREYMIGGNQYLVFRYDAPAETGNVFIPGQ